MNTKGKLELTWVGKENRPRLEPRILVEDPAFSYGDRAAENMLIHGDNLLALKALEQDFGGKIKCIYIDPPYNTGSAFTHYDDGLEHSIWLTMMRDRLELLHSLLSPQGSLWISIDDNECHYLKILCDEVLGRQNFVATCIWQKVYSPKSTAKHLSDMHDYVLVYAKDISRWRRNLLPRMEKQDRAYRNPDNDPRGRWKPGDLSARNYYSQGTYPITCPSGRVIPGPPQGMYWRVSPQKLRERNADNRIWWGKDGNNVPAIKRFLSEVLEGIVPQTMWFHEEVGHNQSAKQHLKEILPDLAELFLTPKPEGLVQRIFQIASSAGDWVLDSFVGSGTTCAAAHKMNRRWIACEMGDQWSTHVVPRLKAVIDGRDPGGITDSEGWRGGGGFKFYRLAETLLVKDKDLSAAKRPVYVINPKYNAAMLVRAICKIENFRYSPKSQWHGFSSEHHFLYVTTKLLSQRHLDTLTVTLGPEEALLIYSTRRSPRLKIPDNVEVKRIPRDLLAKCTFEEDK
jgi:adenine-specific DNA-methyltransferase